MKEANFMSSWQNQPASRFTAEFLPRREYSGSIVGEIQFSPFFLLENGRMSHVRIRFGVPYVMLLIRR